MSVTGRDMMDVVCYHYPCIDGVFSALAAHLHYKEAGTQVRFVPLTVFKEHRAEELDLQGGETVYMCDYSGPPGFAVAAAAKAARVVVLDHHKTALDTFADRSVLPPNLELHLNMGRSGATIALDWFKPSVPQALEQAFRFVEDADLWAWKLEGSREFHTGVGALDLEFDCNKNPGIFDVLRALDVGEVMASGRVEMEAQALFIASAVTRAYQVQLGGAMGRARGWGVALAVEIADGMGKHRSRLGNDLCERACSQGLASIGVVAYREDGMPDADTIKLSLRGAGDETDTTPVSEAFGGGGHRLASSCIVRRKEFEGWAVKD